MPGMHGVRRRTAAGCAPLAALLLAAQATSVSAQGTNWASLANGASATSSGVGSWAGVYGYANNSIDGHRRTYWSDDGLRGGSHKDLPAAGLEPDCSAKRQCAGPNAYDYDASSARPFCATYPFWLRIKLAAATSIQTVQLVIAQDMTYDVQTGSSPSGPWTTQRSRACTLCTQGTWDVTNKVQSHVFPAPVTTQYIQIAISYSGAAGPGACGGCKCKGVPTAACTSPDFCSWATNIYEVAAFSPGAATWLAPPAPSPPSPPLQQCPAGPLVSQKFLDDGSGAAGYINSTTATLFTILDPLVAGRGMLLTSLGTSGQEGTVELKQNATWKSSCACGTQGGGAVVTANLTSGAGTVAGDGVLLALVDSTKQTPGATAYVQTLNGCGMATVRPQYALILEFTTRDTTTCTGGNTKDLRLVRTYGAADAPVELVHTRQPLSAATCEPSCTLAPYMYSGAWWEAQIFLPTFMPSVAPDYEDMNQEIQVYTDGTLRMVLANNSFAPASFYVVAAGRTSDGANDRNGVANVHVDCVGNVKWAPDNDVSHQYYSAAAGLPRMTLLAVAVAAAAALL